ncbi:TRAP transporter substrate-binding protein [Epibacterium ulvae]|uniref:TRAP transporter substrate-binding protein n=1 Tax=Epibacterium ulvae TaxID=1156985 RepID=UPI001BFC22C5|nr:TRAP transporter substrate-binding protein [Epibacterium ulvae]MBT8154195.1 TRAP transporter substrate-binding protein [Epibacterium ulvae]
MKLFTFASALAATVAMSGAAWAETIQLRLGHTGAPTHHYQTISQMFADTVKERTGGAVEIQVFPADQLGKQLEAVEGTMLGTQDIFLVSDTVLSNWIPDMGILNLPFLFSSLDDVHEVLEGPVGDKLEAKMEGSGALVIGWWMGGLRNITNNVKPIEQPSDLDGVKIRVPEGEVFVETFKAMGANPVVISFGELYSALQLGTADAQENPPAHILTKKFYEVQAYTTKSAHIYLGSPLIMNEAKLMSIPEEHRKVLLDTATEMAAVHLKMVNDLEDGQWAELAELGNQINDVDTTPFKEATAPVIDMFKGKLDAAIIEEIQAQLAN